MILSKIKRQEPGQSIIEVIFATVVVALVLVAVLSTILASLQNSRMSLEQTRATNYGEEVLEWVRQHRSLEGWSTLASNVPNVNDSADYCLTSLPSDWSDLGSYSGECERTDVILDTPFRRQLTLNRISANEVETNVEITWPGKNGDTATSLKVIFARW